MSLKAALEKGCHVLCITTLAPGRAGGQAGGQLSRSAVKENIPLVKIPSGLMPREALGYSFSPLLVIFGRLGLSKDYSSELKQCAGQLKKWVAQYKFESDDNPAFAMMRVHSSPPQGILFK